MMRAPLGGVNHPRGAVFAVPHPMAYGVRRADGIRPASQTNEDDMRIAVMSDVHGFDLALETVLADLEARGPFAEIVAAGDLCEVGPAPARVLDLLRARGISAVQGNTDRDLVEAARAGRARGEVAYAIKQIGADGLDFLAALPFSRRFTPPRGRSPDDDLLVVHANPHNLSDKLDPALTDEDVSRIIGDVRMGAIAFGHIHICYTRRRGNVLLADVSAVGNPKDGDLRCAYGILTWDDAARTWRAELRRLAYPVEATVAQIRASGLPDPEQAIAKLLRASY
jgi:predicted phosphodiesterase